MTVRKSKVFFKKSVALLLSILVVLTSLNSLVILAQPAEHNHASAVDQQDNVWSGTTGGLVANNYELNEFEKAILACTGLVGQSYSVKIPADNSEGLVTVDADTQTVTAVPYTTNGFVWEPTAAVIKYNNADGSQGTDINVPLSKVGENYIANFTKPANSYRVEVTYSLYIAVDAALQQVLLNAPYYLADGYSLTDTAAGQLGLAVEAIESKMEELRTIYNGIEYVVEYEGQKLYSLVISLPEGKCKEAIGNIIADYDNGNGQLTLGKDIEAYKHGSSKVQYMMENGAKFKDDINWFYNQIAAINTNSADLLNVAEQLENLANGTGDGTIEGIKALANKKVEEAVQKIIKTAVDKANNEYGIDISALLGKTRENDAIYNEIENQRGEFEKLAQSAESMAAYYDQAAANWESSNPTQAEKYRQEAKKYRDQANQVRTTGMEALDTLETKIREVYTLGDEKVAEIDGMKSVALSKAADIREIVNGKSNIGTVVSAVRSINRQKWEYIGKKLVKDGITAAEYAELDKAVKAAVDANGDPLAEEHNDFEIKEKLFATSTVISAMVDQYVVNIKINANVVPKASVDSSSTISLTVVSTQFPMDKNTSADDVLAAIKASGIETAALGQWDSYYNINSDNYNRTVVILDSKGKEIKELGALSDDITYTVTYAPKTLKINETYKSGSEQITEVPYGYNWRLPRPAELTKSYDYKINGIDYRENTIVRIVEDIEVSRTEGKAIAAKTLAEIVAASKVPGVQLSEKEKNVLNSNAFLVDTIHFRTPDSNDNLTKIIAVGNGYKLTAQAMNAGLLGSDAEWIPVSAYPVLAGGKGAEFAVTKNGTAYEAEFECDEIFTSVQVVYQLSIEGLDAATISALANIANVLSEDIASQEATLDYLCNQNNFYENLGQVNKVILGTLGTVVKNMSPETKDAINLLTEKCIDPATEKTYLYGYLTQYKSENGGMSYYYKADNAANIRKQIELVNTYLPIVWNDPEVRAAASDYAAGAVAKVDSVLAQLKATDLKPVNALVNTNSPYVDNMLAAVTATGTTTEHTGISGTVVMETLLSAVAPGQTSFTVEIQVLNKNDGLVNTYKKEMFRKQGNKVTVAELEAIYNELLAEIPNSKYYVAEKNLPTSDIVLGENAVKFTCALRPMSYTVKIEGEADQTLYAFDAYTITLPGTGNSGLKYVYTIGSSKVEVLSGALENFSITTSIDEIDRLFGNDRELVITRQLIDINKENLLTFINNFNNAFANAGFTYGNNLAVAFIPVEDKNGNLSVVLRVTSNYQNLQPASLASEMMALIQDLSYVGINGSPLFGLNSDNELKLYVQTIINMIVNSGLGFDTFANIVDANGNIKELNLGANAIGATGNKIVLGNGKVINDVDALGGKLIESTMQFGVNVNNATSVPFYVTYQDFDAQADVLAKVKKGAEQITPYINISGKDGALNLTLNVPDTAYAYIMTALLITGEVDFKTLQSYELDDIIEYMSDLIKPLFEDDKTGYDTFINTIKQTGFFDAIEGFDFEANRAFVEFFYDTIDGLFDSIDSTGSSKGGLYTGSLTYSALDVLFNSNVMLEEYKSMIAELDTGVTLPITFKLVNRTTNYEALVLDIFGNGITNKYYMARKAADAIAKAQDGAIVVLLSNVYGNLVFNNDVTLNLNGYSIAGDLTAKGNVTIVDSTLDTKKCGSVVGDLKVSGGSYNIGAGKFLTDVSKYLKSGYYLDNGVVSNGCFSIVEKNGTIDIYLGTDYISLDKSAAKVMATDLIAKLVMNFYACSELKVDNNGIYETKFINVTESLDTPSVLLNKLIGCFDYVGSSAFATQFMADVTDFGAIADAIDNELPLISYTIQQSAYNPHMTYEQDDYFSFNLTSSENKKIFNINVYIADEVNASHKNRITSILRELDKISTFNALKVDITKLEYGKSGFVLEGSAAADVLIDLSTSVDYPVIIAAMLAYDASGAERTKIVNAIKSYQTTNSAKAIMAVIDGMTIADAMSALENAKSTSFANILAKLGIKSDSAIELEANYTIARKLLGIAIDYADINGVEKALGGLKVNGEYGTYAIRYAKSDDTYADLTLKLFSEEKAITVKDKYGVIYLNTDSLTEALNSIKTGATIYVNKTVELTSNVNLPETAFTIAGSENIKFNGYKFWFLSSKTVLTIDTDISANVACDYASFCSDITCTKDGDWYIFRLDGEKHEWEIIPAVEPECGKPGSTEGEWCKHCHIYKEGKEPVEIPALEHKYNGVVTPPTCFDGGYTTYTCENCGDSYVNDFTDATNHHGTTVTIPGKAATCTEDGLTEGSYCSACGTVFAEQEVIPAHHTPGAYEVPPTCTEPGYTGGTKCTVCGEELTPGSLVFPTGHNVTIIPGKAATCTENGYTAGAYCSTCGYVHVSPTIIYAPGHKVVIDEAKDPTCTEIGYTEGSHCENCGEVFVEKQVILPKGHTPEVIPGKPATTTETGLTEGSKCSECGEILVAQKELAKLPIIYAPTPNVEADGNIRGAKVDVDNKLIYLDVNPDGFKASEFADVNFKTDNATITDISIYNYNGTFKRGANDLVCTGDVAFVTAKNADGVVVTAEYSIVIVGDVNGDGKANSRDTVLIKLAYMEQTTLEGLAVNAADVNYDGKLNARDTVIIESKYVLWPENEYVSQTK